MNKFTEAKLEQAFIELLGNEDFPHYLGNTISRINRKFKGKNKGLVVDYSWH